MQLKANEMVGSARLSCCDEQRIFDVLADPLSVPFGLSESCAFYLVFCLSLVSSRSHVSFRVRAREDPSGLDGSPLISQRLLKPRSAEFPSLEDPPLQIPGHARRPSRRDTLGH